MFSRKFQKRDLFGGKCVVVVAQKMKLMTRDPSVVQVILNNYVYQCG